MAVENFALSGLLRQAIAEGDAEKADWVERQLSLIFEDLIARIYALENP